jgi:hypothetical protein
LTAKVTKTVPGRKASLPHRPLRCKSGKTWAAIFLHLSPYRLVNLYAKSCDALPALLATIVLPDFTRSFPAGKKRCYSRKKA